MCLKSNIAAMEKAADTENSLFNKSSMSVVELNNCVSIILSIDLGSTLLDLGFRVRVWSVWSVTPGAPTVITADVYNLAVSHFSPVTTVKMTLNLTSNPLE